MMLDSKGETEGSIAKVSSTDGITGVGSGSGWRNPLISMSGPICSSFSRCKKLFEPQKECRQKFQNKTSAL